MRIFFIALIIFILGFGLSYIFLRGVNMENGSDIISAIKKNDTQIAEITSQNCAFLPWWDFPISLAEFSRNADSMHIASPFIYIVDPQGSIETKHILTTEELNILSSLNVKVIPTISNDFDPERISNIINNKQRSSSHISDLLSIIEESNYDGILIDYELMHARDKDAFSVFIDELSESMRERNYELIVALHPKRSDDDTWTGSQAQDWHRLARSADKLLVMAYDYHWSGSKYPGGPIAPVHWVDDVVSYVSEVMPADKAILGLGIYAYDWSENSSQADIYTITQLNRRLQNIPYQEMFDDDSKSPHLSYSQNNVARKVWFENVESLSVKLVRYNDKFSGFCVWRAGGIPDDYWDIFKDFSSH